ncbi:MULTISPECIES: hypothetical protein [unclassified Cyanobium]|uniref:choice-of-anchor I domain-containing protein n=1 Tax=unclassified Cyanobium TaxID=2627006 RepID=UPI0016491D46|nr:MULTISPECIES: hypothetical protein [unclassified Cyanobium]MBE9154323.1 hypothetical protein [Cyanobium sp. LEGE 06113]QNI71917.1 putative alkaline phosphatase [Cyanobium sp. NS01]
MPLTSLTNDTLFSEDVSFASFKNTSISAFFKKLFRQRPWIEPAMPLVGRIDLTPFSQDPSGDDDGLVAEISASVFIGHKLFTLSSGGSNLVSLTDWSNSADPVMADQLDFAGFETTSIAAFGNLFAVAATPDGYGDSGADGNTDPTPESLVRFFSINPRGKLKELGEVSTGFLSDGTAFSRNGRQLYVANEGEPNADYSVDPVGSVSIIELSGKGRNKNFEEIEIALPDLNSDVELLGSGIRFGGNQPGVTDSFGQDAEPEYVAAAGSYLFVTLQETNTVARIDLDTNKVDAYIGLGWVNYSKVSVDLDDRDDGFEPKTGQLVVGLRQPDGLAAWEAGRSVYFATANEGDGREYGDFEDARRNSSLGYVKVPERLDLIVDGNNRDRALVLSNALGDADASNDFSFEDTSGAPPSGTPVSFGSRSLSIYDGITGQLLWDSWMTDSINGTSYNTSLQNIAQFAGIYDDGRSDAKGVEPESVSVVNYRGSRYLVGSLERTDAGDAPDEITQGGLLVVYDVSETSDVDFVTYQQVSRSPEGLEVIEARESPTGRLLLGVSSEFNSNSVELLDFGALLNNGNGVDYLNSDLANANLYQTLDPII